MRCLDVEAGSSAMDWRAPAERRSTALALREGGLWRRALVPVDAGALEASAFVEGGTYLIVGGAGTIGFDLSMRLARRCGATVVWMGRRPLEGQVAERAAAVAEAGGEVLYVQADVGDPEAVEAAVAELLGACEGLDGVVFAALAFAQAELAQLDAASFAAAHDYKVEGVRHLVDALRGVALDFFLIVSSIQSMVGDRGQGAYAAASAYQDALADAGVDAPWPLKVVDCGYWGSGPTAEAGNRERLAAIGHGLIDPEQGLDAIEGVLASDLARVVLIDAAPDVLAELGALEAPALVPGGRAARSSLELATHEQPLRALTQGVSFDVDASARAVWEGRLDAGLLALFAGLGLNAGALEDWRTQAGVQPRYHRLFDSLVGLLRERGLLEETASGCRLVAKGSGVSAPLPASLEPHQRLLDTCVAAAPGILRGETLATDVLFPGGSTELVEGIYKDNPVADGFNQVCAGTVARAVEARLSAGAEVVRVLELGAGTGGTSAGVLAALGRFGAAVEYTYTDVSEAFLDHGRARFAGASTQLRFALLDASAEPTGQGFAAKAYDLVLAANVLHATARIRETLGHARALLRRGGWLVLNEVTRVEAFTTLTFGLLDGWWAFDDEALRLPGGPLLDVPGWRRVLAAEGFVRSVALGEGGQHVLVAEADGRRQRPRVQQKPRPSAPRPVAALAGVVEQPPVSGSSTSSAGAVAECLAKALSMDPGEIDGERAFAEYGLDSLTGIDLVTALNRRLGLNLRTTVLYDYGSYDALVAHIDGLPEFVAAAPAPAPAPARVATPVAPAPVPARAQVASTPSPVERSRGAVAIIGMSGRYPGAVDLDAYWSMLEAGRCAVREVPPERWSLDGFHDPQRGVKRRSYCKVGGFIDAIDEFDPSFFRFSRAEAEQTAPQQRLFLEQAWRTIEDAGYSAQRLAESDCGVIAGGLDGDYLSRLVAAGAEQPQALWGTDSSVIAARVAYFLNLRGPTVVLNTACSSALTAIHLACDRIRSGQNSLMLAGASFLLDRAFYVFAAQAGMLSPAGVCRAFDDRADGFVPGEGVGLVLLKSLDEALRDGDRVHGVIRASGINQDGRTNGITAPSTVSQTQLEAQVYRDFDVDPASIGYIETHGTGTSLGDPIEYQALTQAWAQASAERGSAPAPVGGCAIASVKTNIGHAAVASGMASVHKVLLAMRHQSIPASLHFEQPNRHIAFAGSPFVVNTETKAWAPANEGPRRAAISGFGMSGTNAHLVLEEAPARTEREAPVRSAYLFPVSARTEEALRTYLSALANHCAQTRDSAARIAWTLQVGRSEFPVRVAFVAADLDELRRAIEAFVTGQGTRAPTRNLRRDPGQPRLSKAELAQRSAELGTERDVTRLREGLATLAEAFVHGQRPDWAALLGAPAPTPVPLPGHPLRKIRCWIPEGTQATAEPVVAQTSAPAVMQVQRGQIDGRPAALLELDPQAWVLDDHRVEGRAIFPGAAYIEFARAAAELLEGRRVAGVHELVWLRPLSPEGPGARVVLSWRGDAEAGHFEVRSCGPKDPLDGASLPVHARGRVSWGEPEASLAEAPRPTGDERELPAGPELYRAFASMGLGYGPSFQVITELRASSTCARARLRPNGAAREDGSLQLSPGLLDGALQSLIGLALAEGAGSRDAAGESASPFVPFMVESVAIHGTMRDACRVQVWREPGGRRGVERFSVRVEGEDGALRVAIRGLSVRRLTPPQPERKPNANAGELLWATPDWRPSPAQPGAPLNPGAVALIGGDEAHRDALARRLGRPVLASSLAEARAQLDASPLAAVVHVPGARPLDEAFTLARLLAAPTSAGPRFSRRARLRLLALHGELDARPLGAFLRSLQAELVGLDVASLGVEAGLSAAEWAEQVAAELGTDMGGSAEVERRVQAGQRSVRRMLRRQPTAPLTPRERAVVLITGGAGGLGAAFARALAKGCAARVVLCGRRPADAAIEALLRELEALGGEAMYAPCDVTNAGAVAALVEQARRRFGAIHGVIHAAGVTRDAKVVDQDPASLATVLGPKLDGARALDEALGASPLDWMVLCGSMSGVWGNPGQAVYAYANAWLDAFAAEREALRAAGRRHGLTCSIAWPLWQRSGGEGMGVDAETQRLLATTMGLEPMPEARGAAALLEALSLGEPAVALAHGRVERLIAALGVEDEASGAGELEAAEAFVRRAAAEALGLALDDVDLDESLRDLGADALSSTALARALEARFGGSRSPTSLAAYPSLRSLARSLATGTDAPTFEVAPSRASSPVERAPSNTEGAADRLGQRLRELVAELVGLGLEEVELHDDLSEFGFDSLKLTEFANQLNEAFGTAFTPAVMFEFDSLASLAEDMRSQGVRLQEVVATQPAPDPAPPQRAQVEQPELPELPELPVDEDAVAIVGMSGRLPGSVDLDAFWSALDQGRDLITEVPAARWDWQAASEAASDVGRGRVRWGGFMPEVDRFDPQFFGISPREAELMDPQQRLILECVWHCIEDAGHRPSSLAGTRTALYVGVAGLDYTELVKQAAGAIGAHNSTGMTHSILANRVSYLLNLRGPSSPVDTACSSSLVAIMHAVAAIRTGAADMAIAGGVNALLSPSMFTAFARAGMLSPRGRCRTFDDSADGYVRGEGVGAVFLKPLRRALADGDTIHAIVRGCAQNHGGRAKSLTAPNPNAQADLLVDAWTRAGLHPSMLDYVEAHGTGTSLGDPIELNALGKAIANFPAPTAEQAMAPGCERVGVGSIKTYVGHLEAAAGIAGVLGVLLAMRHGKLPGNLHFETLNRHIRLEGTPLDIVDRPRPWPRSRDAQGRAQPRRAGVSSFGFGGANAHVVLEEYVPAADGRPACAGPQLVVLSARSEAALQRQAQALLGHLEGDGQPRLDDLAFTLADGREAFADRLAIVASSVGELLGELDAWLRGDSRSRALQGSVDALRRRLVGGRGGQPGVVDTTSAAALEGVGRRWVAGELHELGELFVGARRVSLPGYAFARERHWISGGPAPTPSVAKPVAPKPAEPAPRPVSAEEGEPFFFCPRWRRVPAPKPVELEARGPLWVVCVEDDPQLVDAVAESLGVDEVSVLSAEVLARPDLRECVAGLPLPEHLVFLGGGPTARAGEEGLELAELATGRALTLLRLIKLLLDLDLRRRALRVSAFSFGVHDGHAELAPLSGQGAAAPADACLHGMLGSLAREYPSWTVELVDLDGDLDGPAAAEALSACLCRGGVPGTWAVRGGAWYARGLETLRPSADARATAGLRRGGAYLILGGSGGLGLTLGRHLAGLGARVALVGRRPLDAELRQTLASFEAEAPGARAIYLRADANAPGSIAAAVREAADAFGGLDGVVHSAMDLCDVAYEAMDEGLLRRALTPKVHGCVELIEACAGLGLDWIALFSSGQSLSTDAGQGNYAAACTFEDAYGRAVAAAGSVPVRVINWGYWGSVGAVKDERYRRRLAARGIRAIEPARGLAAFEAVLAAPSPQLLAFAAEPWLRERMGIDDDAALSVLGVAPSREGALVVEPPPLDLAVLERARGSAAALTRQSAALLVGALSREGALPERGRSFEPEAAAARLGVDGAHRGVWAAFVHLLRDAGALERSSEGTWTVSAEAEALRREAANTEALAARYPELGPHLRLLQACVPASPAILRGTTTAPEVLFPGGSMELVEGIYAGDAITDYHNQLAAAAVEAALRERLREDPNARLRVLEIGAGTGGTSASVLARLAKLGWADRLEYAYTDLSAGFVRHGERSFGAHAFARFFELDLERPFPEQGVALGSVDVVLAANVVHATRDVAASVARIKTALRPGGAIVLLETVATQAFATLTFGMTPGWWLFEDPHWRLDHAPLLGPALWRRLLAQEGFGAVAIHGLPGVAEGELVQGVVVGHSDGVVGTRAQAAVVEAAAPAPATRSVEPSGHVEGVEGEAVLDWLRERFARVLKLDPADFDPRATFEIYGVDSLVGMELVRELETELGPLPATLLFENPTLEALADTLKSSAAEGLAKALPTVEAPRPRAPQPEPARAQASRPEPAADTPASDLSDAVVDGLSDDALDSLLARLDRALATPQALRTNSRDRR
ncbi:SDR family NAD(P)-dependent oxidoreductase [Plesiocystis pacifica]|uniref:SDR family NAD(P)-dependent oxidoreductase n=1 Tax=Plesiocystis pacifica TaxID=191768 RepID=UPI0002F103D3|nr:SDR family NAD(P)-dependent oxidoreductase [Plesiocystis pacifica]